MKTDKPLITVVVPVYQTCQFLGECVESLLQQSYENLEIILVDDGSRDGSERLCDEYAQRDNRIHVIHQDNKGPMAARKAGFDHGNGTYFAFVDSDDMVSPLYVEMLYDLILKYDADIAACTYEKDRRKFIAGYHGKFKDICITSQQMLRFWHGRYKKYETVMWNKLYHKKVLKKNELMAQYQYCRRYEDILVSHLLVQNAEKIALTVWPLYFYRTREGSITSEKAGREKIEQNLDAQRRRMEFFAEKGYWRSCCRLLRGYLLHRLLFAYQLLLH